MTQTIGVFCGSAVGASGDYVVAAHAVGQFLARQGHGIVYGGGRVGLMGAVAAGSLETGGTVTGVMPRALVDKEIAHTSLSDLIITPDMHTRKAAMADRADAFLALPGGTGTMEEFFEQWTWAQIGHHQKPIGLLNINGFFDPLLDMTRHMVRSGFLSQTHNDMLICSAKIDVLTARFAAYTAPPDKTYEHTATQS